MSRPITLDFGAFSLVGELFADPVAERLHAALPCAIDLTWWGAEAYGAIAHDLGKSAPQAIIPAGGIAYTNRGNYLCLFFGQTPAWPVEHVGRICGDAWQRVLDIRPLRVTVRC